MNLHDHRTWIIRTVYSFFKHMCDSTAYCTLLQSDYKALIYGIITRHCINEKCRTVQKEGFDGLWQQNVEQLLCLDLLVHNPMSIDKFHPTGIDKFVAMLEETLQDETGSFILSNELLLMEALKFSLTVHNSYRPLDGFIIQFKKHTDPNVTVSAF